eukprot:4411585-Alexandrium_andersonii.AAC.1
MQDRGALGRQPVRPAGSEYFVCPPGKHDVFKNNIARNKASARLAATVAKTDLAKTHVQQTRWN